MACVQPVAGREALADVYFDCRDVSLAYGSRTVATAVNLSVSVGDFLCIVGENGSGKSTLLRTLLQTEVPAAGTIRLGGGLTRDAIGYLPQQGGERRDFPAVVGEVVLSGCLNRCGMRPFYSAAEKRLAASCLAKTGLDGFAHRPFEALSGGEQRRVLLARALCAARKALLLDEPAAGLDPSATAELYTLVDGLNQREGLTLVMVTHDIRFALRHAKHILHMGRHPKFYGTAEAYSRTALCGAFLDDDGEARE